MRRMLLHFREVTAKGSNHLSALEASDFPAAANMTTGWIVGTTAPTVYSLMEAGVERAAATFGATELPNANPDNTLGDSFRTGMLFGTFAAGTWKITLTVRGITSGGDADGYFRLRVYKGGLPTGFDAGELTTQNERIGPFTNIATGSDTTVQATFTLPEFTCGGEYLFFQFAWEISGAGGAAGRDVHFREGSCYTTSTEFEPDYKKFFFKDAIASGSNHLSLQDGGPALTDATTVTGWTVGTTAPTVYARMAQGVERAAGTFAAGDQPDGAPDNTLGDCFRTERKLNGKIAVGSGIGYTTTMAVIAVTSGGDQDGAFRIRFWKSPNADGSSATEIESGPVNGPPYTNVGTGAESSAGSAAATWLSTVVTFDDEYLFFQVAWKITGAGGAATRDILIRVGDDCWVVEGWTDTKRVFWLTENLAPGGTLHRCMDEGEPPATATMGTGWTVGTTTPTKYQQMFATLEASAAGFGAGVLPDGSPDAATGDCFRSRGTMKGHFKPGTWKLDFPVIGVSGGGDQDGAISIRILKGSDDGGSGAIDVGGGVLTGSTVTDLTTSAEQISAVSATLQGFEMDNEYLFIQVAWKITGAGGAAGRDVLLRVGANARILTSEWVPDTPINSALLNQRAMSVKKVASAQSVAALPPTPRGGRVQCIMV